MTSMFEGHRSFPMYNQTWDKLPVHRKQIHSGRFYAFVYNEDTTFWEWIWVFMTQADYVDDHKPYLY